MSDSIESDQSEANARLNVSEFIRWLNDEITGTNNIPRTAGAEARQKAYQLLNECDSKSPTAVDEELASIRTAVGGAIIGKKGMEKRVAESLVGKRVIYHTKAQRPLGVVTKSTKDRRIMIKLDDGRTLKVHPLSITLIEEPDSETQS